MNEWQIECFSMRCSDRYLSKFVFFCFTNFCLTAGAVILKVSITSPIMFSNVSWTLMCNSNFWSILISQNVLTKIRFACVSFENIFFCKKQSFDWKKHFTTFYHFIHIPKQIVGNCCWKIFKTKVVAFCENLAIGKYAQNTHAVSGWFSSTLRYGRKIRSLNGSICLNDACSQTHLISLYVKNLTEIKVNWGAFCSKPSSNLKALALNESYEFNADP